MMVILVIMRLLRPCNVQPSFNPPFTECSGNSEPSRSLRPQTLRTTDDLSLEKSSRPSAIDPKSENDLKSVK